MSSDCLREVQRSFYLEGAAIVQRPRDNARVPELWRVLRSSLQASVGVVSAARCRTWCLKHPLYELLQQ